jgi:hypothetical protein
MADPAETTDGTSRAPSGEPSEIPATAESASPVDLPSDVAAEPEERPIGMRPNPGWDLRNRAEELRPKLVEHYGKEKMRLGLARDDAAREAFSAEQAAKAADQQVKRQATEVASIEKELEETAQHLARAEQAVDLKVEEEAGEELAYLRERLRVATARRDHAEEQATRLRLEMARSNARVTELEQELQSLQDRTDRAEKTLDAMENKGDLIAQATISRDVSTQADRRADELEAAGKPEEAEEQRTFAEQMFREANALEVRAAAIVINESVLEVIPQPEPLADVVEAGLEGAAIAPGLVEPDLGADLVTASVDSAEADAVAAALAGIDGDEPDLEVAVIDAGPDVGLGSEPGMGSDLEAALADAGDPEPLAVVDEGLDAMAPDDPAPVDDADIG